MKSLLGPGAAAAMLVLVSGCGSVDNDPAPGEGVGQGQQRFTLTATLAEASEGLVLATGEKTIGVDGPVAPDIYVSLGKVFMIGGQGDEPPFCEQGNGFTDVAEIPSNDEGCAWNVVYLTGNAPGLERGVQGEGYLVRDRSGSLYRLLVIEHVVEAGPPNVATVTFDLLPVD